MSDPRIDPAQKIGQMMAGAEQRLRLGIEYVKSANQSLATDEAVAVRSAIRSLEGKDVGLNGECQNFCV